MTYVVTDNCIACKYTDCVEVCPVDCFYEGENMLVIHPDECIDCGVCEPECPADAIRPDGDIELGDVDYSRFNVPGCPMCGGVLKPDVVFFGGSVPKARVERAWAGLRASDAVLVAGSSLMVWSGFRFVRDAARTGLPVMAINYGKTRADDLLTHKIDDDCVDVLDAALGRG